MPQLKQQTSISGQRILKKVSFHRGDVFHGVQCNVTPSCVSHTVMPLLLSEWFLLQCNGDSWCFFVGRTTIWIAPTHGGIVTPSNTWFFRPPWVSPHAACGLVKPFLHSISVWPTHRQTQLLLRATYVAVGRIVSTESKQCCLKRWNYFLAGSHIVQVFSCVNTRVI